MSYQYDPSQYRSPQRVYDAVNNEFLDLWRYEYEFNLTVPDGRVISIVPVFEYDKGSVPPFVQNWLPRDDKQANVAFLIHDWLYVEQQIQGEWIERSEADKIFYELLRHAGMRWTKARLAWLGVKAGGWTSFNKRGKEKGNPYV